MAMPLPQGENMEQTAKTKTIKIVCIVLAAVIVAAALATGLFVYFNSNTFRFRMSVFTGEYYNSNQQRSDEAALYFYVRNADEPYTEYTTQYWCRVDGENAIISYYTMGIGLVDVDDEVIGEETSATIKKLACSFNNGCVVDDNFITFGSTEKMNITQNKYYGFEERNYPVEPERTITVADPQNNEFECSFITSFIVWRDKRISVKDTKFKLKSKDIEVTEKDGTVKKIRVFAEFIKKDQ